MDFEYCDCRKPMRPMDEDFIHWKCDHCGHGFIRYSSVQSLRDRFAGMAMQGVHANTQACSWGVEKVARYAYKQADKMIEARKKKGENDAT
jgi:hypothetical protein